MRVVTDFRKSKSGPWIGATHLTLLPTCMVGGLKPTCCAVGLAEARDIFAVMGLDALEPFEEIDVEIGAAELAIGDRLEADILLSVDDLANAFVLERVQVLSRKLAGGEFFAGRLEAFGSQEAADMIGAEGRTGHRFPPGRYGKHTSCRRGDIFGKPPLSPLCGERAGVRGSANGQTFAPPLIRRSAPPSPRERGEGTAPYRLAPKNARSIAAASLSRMPP